MTGGSVASIKPIFAGDAAVFTRRDEAAKAVELDYNLPPEVAAPLKAGQQIGTAQVMQDGKATCTIALVAPSMSRKRSGGVVGRILGKL